MWMTRQSARSPRRSRSSSGTRHARARSRGRCRAWVVQQAMPGAPGWVAVAIDVEAIDDHRQRGVAVEAGVGVRWKSDEVLEGAGQRLAALAAIAALEQGSES